MDKYVDILSTNEKIVIVAHRHILFMILNAVLWLVGSILIIIFAGFVFVRSPWQGTILAGLLLLVSLVPLGITIHRFLVWRTERYILTTFRIIQFEGILNRRLFDSSLEMINDVEMRQTLFGRLFNYGSIHILTAADTAINDLDGIEDPFNFKRQMVETKMELAKHKDGDDPKTAPTTASSKSADYESNARLVVALTELRNAGTISDKEFDEKIRQITGD